MELVTRSDLDGLVAGAILLEAGAIDEGKIRFVHPKDVQDGKVELTRESITTNLPFDPRVGMAFDHHESETERLSGEEEEAVAAGRLILSPTAKSAARVVYEYYKAQGKVGRIREEIVAAADKCDSADLSLEDILHPTGWVLLHYIMDARSGFGRFHDFRISNYDLMMELMHYIVTHSIEEVLALPDVQERAKMYFEQEAQFEAQLKKCSKLEGDTVIIDLRNEDIIYTGNRFKIYALFPEAKYSVHVVWGRQKMNTAVMIGRSIIDRSGKANIGNLCLKYGGGGHAKAGTCQLDNDKVDKLLPEILKALAEADA